MAKRIWLARHWRTQRNVFFTLFGIELAFTIAALALFGIADPNLYRTKLQEDGFQNGFNSGLTSLLLEYANHVKIDIPLVWSGYLTTWNLVISVVSTFLLLVKAIMFVLGTWYPLLSFLVHAALAAVYAYSTYGQLGSDLADPARPQNGPPWYITKSCSVAFNQRLVGYCQQAKACLAVTVILIAIYLIHMVVASHSIKPTAAEIEARRSRDEEDDLKGPYYHGQAEMYSTSEKPPDTATFYAATNPLNSPATQRAQEKQPAPAMTKEQEAMELAQIPQSPRAQHGGQDQQQSAFAASLVHNYMREHDGAPASEQQQQQQRTPISAMRSPGMARPLDSSLPFFAPPPTMTEGKPKKKKKKGSQLTTTAGEAKRRWWSGAGKETVPEQGKASAAESGFVALPPPGSGSGPLPFRQIYGS